MSWHDPGGPGGGSGRGSVVTDAQVVHVGGTRPYDVVIGSGITVPATRRLLGGTRLVALVHPQCLHAAARDVAAALGEGPGAPRVELLAVPDGEPGKDLAVAARLWDQLSRLRLGRDDAVVGFGGGATTDLAGFVAAAWLRGVRVVHLPTSLLGMVDAAIGGKTAVNLPAGKNLVGAFHPPAGVVCDLDRLASLPPEERSSGLAEVAKCGFVADPALLGMLDRPEEQLAGLVARAVAVKARVVSADPRESGPREILNYGHTLGHAIERVEGFRWRHGAAISVGMVYAAGLSHRLLGLPEPDLKRHAAVLGALGLPVSYRPDAWPALLAAMRSDKKARAGSLRLVLLRRLADPVVLPVDEADLAAGYADVCS
jgi:3-dehydroquinate synthase